MNGLDDGVTSVLVPWCRRGRCPVRGEQSVGSIERAVADRHGVQVPTQQKPQLLVLSAQVPSLLLQSLSMQHSGVDAPHQLLQLWKLRSLLHTETQVSVDKGTVHKYYLDLNME